MALAFGSELAAAGDTAAFCGEVGGGLLSSRTDLGFIHRFEPATNPDAPTILLLHGTGGDETSLLTVGRAIAPGATLLSPRGKVLEHGMARFFRRLAEGVFDQEDLAFRTAELAFFVDVAVKAYGLPPGRVVAVGYSNGANIASSMLLRFPEHLAGVAAIRGMVPFVPDPMPDLQRKPVLLLNGTDDPIVQTDEVEELANIFRAANAEITLHWETAGHLVSQGDLLMAFDWVRKFYRESKPSSGTAI